MASFITTALKQSPFQLASNVINEQKKVSGTGHTGNWGTTDYGWTEGLKNALMPKAYAADSGQVNRAQAPENYWQSNQAYGPAIPTNTGASNASRSAIPSSGQTVSNPFAGYSTALDQSRDANNSMIDQMYNQEMGRLGQLEDTTRGNYATAIQQAQTYFPQFQEQLAKEQQTDMGALTAQEDQTKMESNKGLARTRQLLSDLQRSQAARMSATGNYSSSVADAFGESFGRKAFDANSQIQQSRDQALQQIGIERQKVENFYSRKTLEAKQNYDSQIISFQQQLQAQLDQINNARGQAANVKAQATMDAWNSYTQNKLSLDQSMAQFQSELDQWKQKNDQIFQEAQVMEGADVLGQYKPQLAGQSLSMANPTSNTPQSQTQQAQILVNKKPLTWEEQAQQTVPTK